MVDLKRGLIIEVILKAVIDELGATGILVCGLYLILHKPLNKMAHHMKIINDELGIIVTHLTEKKSKVKDPYGQD